MSFLLSKTDSFTYPLNFIFSSLFLSCTISPFFSCIFYHHPLLLDPSLSAFKLFKSLPSQNTKNKTGLTHHPPQVLFSLLHFTESSIIVTSISFPNYSLTYLDTEFSPRPLQNLTKTVLPKTTMMLNLMGHSRSSLDHLAAFGIADHTLSFAPLISLMSYCSGFPPFSSCHVVLSGSSFPSQPTYIH